MITQNGLSLFRALLSSTAIKPTNLTNVNGQSNIITEKTISGLFITDTGIMSLPESWLTGQGTYYANQPDFSSRGSIYMNDYSLISSFTATDKNNAMSTHKTTYINSSISNTEIHYFAPTEYILTIPANPNVSTITPLASVPIPDNRGIEFFNIRTRAYPNFQERTVLNSAYLWGIPPHADSEYITISYPAAYNAINQFYGNTHLLGTNNKLTFNLGYSSDTESVDDYDLSSPVYNKKLNPMQLKVENTDSKLIFTCTFKNYETESITVKEFGLYSIFSDNNGEHPVYPDDIKTLESGRYIMGVQRYITQPITNEYISAAISVPYLIARKVLPQAVTIPPDGIATFKYTVDLSEMQAQENITYSEE